MTTDRHISMIDMTAIVAGDNGTGHQDRTVFDPVKLADLAESIKAHGLLQPITVRELGETDLFQIVAGERRFRACELLGWQEIPAIIVDVTDDEAAALMLAENTGRENLNPIDEAGAYQVRIQRMGWSVDDCARSAGVSPELVRRRLSLLNLRWDIRHMVATGNLALGHAEAMAKLDTNRQQIALRVMEEGGNPSLAVFRGIVNRLHEEQCQDTLIDLSAFWIEQLQQQAEMPRRGKAAVTGAPTCHDLPAVTFGSADNTAAVIDRWIASLVQAGREAEAAVAGTLYTALVKGNFLQVPANSKLLS